MDSMTKDNDLHNQCVREFRIYPNVQRISLCEKIGIEDPFKGPIPTSKTLVLTIRPAKKFMENRVALLFSSGVVVSVKNTGGRQNHLYVEFISEKEAILGFELLRKTKDLEDEYLGNYRVSNVYFDT